MPQGLSLVKGVSLAGANDGVKIKLTAGRG